jgi:hypothetical protein
MVIHVDLVGATAGLDGEATLAPLLQIGFVGPSDCCEAARRVNSSTATG